MNQSRNATSKVSLPSGFVTVRDILDGKVQAKSKVSTIGIVTDYRVPVPTKRTDWKCQIKLYDISSEDDRDELPFNIFRSQDDMPVASLGDVILITSVTVQVYQGLTIVTNFGTKIHIYEASKIPRPPQDASCALRPPTKRQTARPGDKENAYVSYMFQKVDKSRLPDKQEFELMQIRSANVKDKFCELKDVQDGKFCDIVAQVVKEPYDLGDKMTVWVSDYTENPTFFHYALGGKSLSGGRDGDPFGYTNKFTQNTSSQSGSEWQGPFGKRSIQLTIYEPHAAYVREDITINTWVLIKNLHIKYGHNAANLEGALREDRAHGLRINISRLDPMVEPEQVNPHLKAALRRKRDYEQTRKKQFKDITDAAKAGEKRKAALLAEHEPKENTKARRKKNRAHLQEPSRQGSKTSDASKTSEASRISEPSKTIEPSQAVAVDGNPAVRCENESIKTQTIKEILQPVRVDVTVDGEVIKLPLPFTCSNYRAHVRVVDFKPSKLVDFAIPKKASSEFDVLSDNEGGSESGSGSDSDADNTRESTALGWQWRFYLQLEDAATRPGQEKQRVWVAVDNPAAQCLIDLDASNLKRHPNNLEALRLKLWLLWGDLEERNELRDRKKVKSLQAAQRGEAPLHSSDNEAEPSRTPQKDREVHNKPFTCCIRQYGITVREPDPTKANARNGKRWERMFALFGTKITGS